MAIRYSAARQKARMDDIQARLNASTGGELQIRSSADVELVTFTMDSAISAATSAGGTPGGAGTGSLLTLTAHFDNSGVEAAVAAGVAENAILYESDGTTVVADNIKIATSAGAGVDMVIDNDNIALGQNVTINAVTIQHINPADI